MSIDESAKLHALCALRAHVLIARHPSAIDVFACSCAGIADVLSMFTCFMSFISQISSVLACLVPLFVLFAPFA